jgi:uncharacterized protein (DUF488 family)
MHTASTASSGPPVILTVGHSNRSLSDFIALLQAHGVTQLVDVRTVPRSRHNPQFNQDTLPAALQAVGIGYCHQPGLGGLRHPRPDARNTGWHHANFQGFADYRQPPAFAAALDTLLQQAESCRMAVMCAEAVPWRCHRSLIADALSVRGIPVEHLLSTTQRQAHRLTPWAQVDGTRLSYPPPAELAG